MALEPELKTYQQNLPQLLAHEGQYVLIPGDAVAGVFASYGDALTAGYERFEFQPFLVQQIQEAKKRLYFPGSINSHTAPGSRAPQW